MSPKMIVRVCVLMVSVAALVAGCSKSKPTGPAAAQAEQAGVGAGTGTGFAIFPAVENPVVFGMNFENMQKSTIWKELWPMAEAKAGEVTKFEEVCGMGLATVKKVVVGGDLKAMQKSSNGKGVVVSVAGDLPQKKVVECAKKMAEKEQEKLEVKEDGAFVEFKSDKSTLWAHFSDGGVVLAPEADKAFLEARIKGTDPLTNNKEFMSTIEKVDTSGTVWFAAKAKAAPGEQAADTPQGGHGSIKLDQGIKADVNMGFASADVATKTATQAKQQMEGMKAMPQFAKFIEKITIASQDTNLNVKVDLSEADVKELLAMAKAQLPLLLGGGF